MAATLPAEADAPVRAGASLYRAVWRWHFYAGLLVLPFLVWLAITGGLYVFKAEIDGWFHHGLKTVVPAATVPRGHGEITAAALAAYPGVLRKYTPAAAPSASAEVGIATARGERLSVYVDPWRAQVLGALPEGGSVAWTIRRLHSLKYFGPVARGAIEIAAGWAIVLVATGIYLWWPRGRRGGVVTVRGAPRQRVFWRDLHAVTGVFVGAMLVFLALTGMPWSVLWGQQVNQWANGHNFGYPAGVRVQVPMSQQRLAEGGPTAWSLEQARLPQSAHAGHAGHGSAAGEGAAPGALGLDAAMAIVERLGLAPGYTLVLPQGPAGVYTASVYPHDLARQRVVHLDQYSGAVLLDMGYGDYGPLGRWLEWGINVHMGQEFGVANQALLVVACLAIVLLCVSAATMWWKRRPAGALGVPPSPADRRALRAVLAFLVLGGLAFPLMGASLLAMWALDHFLTGKVQ
ncbi:PepSY domain-containing protein [Pseudorhodoferax sp. LjRoot39]|uniref:PepSY-associated TM helix domain-containing protein n=1 Tax=Pseudorhodoferax sp. LjRoot39 TaxID=3342328 RepID=UPI003ECC8C15